MILKSLYDYAMGNPDRIPPRGLELREIEFTIVIDRDGNFLRFESNRIDKKKCKTFLVAKGFNHNNSIKANTLWDNGKYVLGFNEKFKDKNEAFISKIIEIAKKHPEDKSIIALKKFYDIPFSKHLKKMSDDPWFSNISTKYENAVFSFHVVGDECLIAEKRSLFIEEKINQSPDSSTGICLITGKRSEIVRLTTPTPFPGNKPSAALVAFQTDSGYDSYGKVQAHNAPISVEAEEMYSKALLLMKREGSFNRANINNRFFLFWGSGNENVIPQAEEGLSLLLNVPAKGETDADEKVGKVIKLFKSIYSGEIRTTLNDRFHILGVATNLGRIAVILWMDCELKQFASQLNAHFQDMEIIDTRPFDKRRPYCGVYSMVSAVTHSGKLSDSTPNLIEEVTEAVVKGIPYPFQLFTGALERIKAELSKFTVSVNRAAILKAYLNRKFKYSSTNKQLQIMLDKNNSNPGYLCGRLAAVLEKIQDDAQSGDSIRTRYMGSASSTPASVFPAMLSLTIHHSEKLKEGSRIFYENMKQEIIDKLPATGFPSHLDLNDQGRFFVGYYHQRSSFYTPKENKE